MTAGRDLVPIELIQSKIIALRDEKVMIDRDLAELYNVETKQLKRAVRRNLDRFPADFMFELTREEYNSLRSQFGTLKRGPFKVFAHGLCGAGSSHAFIGFKQQSSH